MLELFRKRGVKKVLDLGCGSGSHLVYLAKHGFEVYGIDNSEEAVKIAEECFRDSGLKGDLRIGSIYGKLPYEDSFFDAVISFRVIHHARINEIRRCVKEIDRILKPSGLIFVTIRKRIPEKKMAKHKILDSRTYVPIEGEETGVVHYLFNKELLKKEFRSFRIKDIRIDYGPKEWESYYCLIGELRSA